MNKVKFWGSLYVVAMITPGATLANNEILSVANISTTYVECEKHDSLIDFLVNNGSISEDEGNSTKCIAPVDWEWSTSTWDYSINKITDNEYEIAFAGYDKATAERFKTEFESSKNNSQTSSLRVILSNMAEYSNLVNIGSVSNIYQREWGADSQGNRYRWIMDIETDEKIEDTVSNWPGSRLLMQFNFNAD